MHINTFWSTDLFHVLTWFTTSILAAYLSVRGSESRREVVVTYGTANRGNRHKMGIAVLRQELVEGIWSVRTSVKALDRVMTRSTPSPIIEQH